MKASRFVTSLLLFLIFFVTTYYGLFRYQIGSAFFSEWWVKAVYDYKMYAAANMESPKVIVLGGSNAMFGINSSVMASRLEMPVLNLSIHAGLDPHFLEMQISEVLGPGDVLVLPLEYEYYSSDDEYSGWFVSNMLAWGEDIYINKLPFMDYLHFLKAVPVEDIWKGLLAKGAPSKVLDKDQVISEVLSINEDGVPRENGYTHKSLTLQGDVLAKSEKPHQRVLDIVEKEGDGYLLPVPPISMKLLNSLQEIDRLVRERKATKIITWPVSVRNRAFDLSQKRDQQRVEQFTQKLREYGIEVECEPALFNYHFALFYDNRYHLNHKGALLRSVNLADCIKQLKESGGRPGFDHESALQKVRYQEHKILFGR